MVITWNIQLFTINQSIKRNGAYIRFYYLFLNKVLYDENKNITIDI